MPERNIQPLRGARFALLALAGIGIPAALACSEEGGRPVSRTSSDGDGSNIVRENGDVMPSQTTELVLPTETPVPATNTPEPPKPTETPFVPKSVLEAPFEPTTIDQVKNLIKAIYTTHPNLMSGAGTSFTKEVMDYNLEGCQSGAPQFAGQPDEIRADRASRCYFMITGLADHYSKVGDDLIFQAEVAIKNYYLSEYEDQRSQQQFIDLIQSARIK